MLLWSLSRIHGSQSTGSFCSWVRVCGISGLLLLVYEPSAEKTDIATDESWNENEYTTYFSCFIFLIFEVFSVVFLFTLNSSVAPLQSAFGTCVRHPRPATCSCDFGVLHGSTSAVGENPLSACCPKGNVYADGRICRTINYILRLFKVFSSLSKQQSYCLGFIFKGKQGGCWMTIMSVWLKNVFLISAMPLVRRWRAPQLWWFAPNFFPSDDLGH